MFNGGLTTPISQFEVQVLKRMIKDKPQDQLGAISTAGPPNGTACVDFVAVCSMLTQRDSARHRRKKKEVSILNAIVRCVRFSFLATPDHHLW